MANVTIIGAGLMGTAMAWPLSDNNHRVNLVGTHLDKKIIESCMSIGYHSPLNRHLPERVKSFQIEDVDKALIDTEVIVSGVNSNGVEWIADLLSTRITPSHQLISITKGIAVGDDGSILTFPEVIAEKLSPEVRKAFKTAAVGGPCIAGELAARRQTCVMFGSEDYSTAEELTELCSTEYYHPIPTKEILSLEISAALKNAFALAAGMAYGMLEKACSIDKSNISMHNPAAALFAEGCNEIRNILQLVGGKTEFASALPGAGDLYVTSMGGRTVRLGKLLGKGKTYKEAKELMVGETLESVEVVTAISKMFPFWERSGILIEREFPILKSLVDVIVHSMPLDLRFNHFFSDFRKS